MQGTKAVYRYGLEFVERWWRANKLFSGDVRLIADVIFSLRDPELLVHHAYLDRSGLRSQQPHS
jgi:hypothetical protein